MNASSPSNPKDKEDAPSKSRTFSRLPEPSSQVMTTSYGRNHPLSVAHPIVAARMTSGRQIAMHVLPGAGRGEHHDCIYGYTGTRDTGP